MRIYPKSGLLALTIAVMFALTACGGADEGAQDSEEPAEPETTEESAPESTGGAATEDTAGMDHEGMDHGEMEGMDHSDMDHGDMESMLMQDGEYSDELFIDNMVPHHQGAVDMAEVALENSERGELVQLSEEIIATQQEEIDELRSIKEGEFGTSEVPMEMDDSEMEMMGMMMDAGELAEQEPFDRAFIDNMIPHHQSAIDMAEIALESSENEEILQLSEEIIAAQQQEIDLMETWREEWYPES